MDIFLVFFPRVAKLWQKYDRWVFTMVLEQHAGQDPGNMLLFIPSRYCVYSTLLTLCSVMNIRKLHTLLFPVPTLQFSYLSTFLSIIVYWSFLILQIDKWLPIHTQIHYGSCYTFNCMLCKSDELNHAHTESQVSLYFTPWGLMTSSVHNSSFGQKCSQ